MTFDNDSPLRVGLIGGGEGASHHLRAYAAVRDSVELVAVCDVVESTARRCAAEAGIDRVYTDVSEMLSDAPIDAVDICTTHDQHAPLAIAAAKSGRHVLVEKPMATSLADCEAMVDAADAAGVTLMVAQNLRYTQEHRALRKEITAGAIGRVLAVRLDLMMDLGAFGPPGSWQFDGVRAGGGSVIMGGVHLLDLARYLFGEAVSVSGRCWTTRPELFVNGSEDYGTASLQLASGAVVELFTSFSASAPPWTWRIMILGEKGTITNLPVGGDLPFGAAALASGSTPKSDGEPFGVPIEGSEVDGESNWGGFEAQILHFAECCRTGAEPNTSGRDNLLTMRQIFGIYESSRIAAPVELTKGEGGE